MLHTGQARGHARSGVARSLTVLALAVLVMTPVAGQEPQDREVPTVEPPLSRLYGSDDLDFSYNNSAAISPDGRWLAYSQWEDMSDATLPADEGMNLWIVPLDGSREAVRLTTGANWDTGLLWFPSGDRILFRSNRPDPTSGQYLMTLDIDPATGAARSVPRQITLEPVVFNLSYAISPDGREVAYVPRPLDETRDSFVLKVIPANGGTARTLWKQREPMVGPVWPGDGFLYFMSWLARGDETAIDPRTVIRRVPVNGGQAETLSTWPDRVRLSADARTVLRRTTVGGPGNPFYAIASVRGQDLARFRLPETMELGPCFTRDVEECLTTTENVTAALEIIPVDGGAIRRLMDSSPTTWPSGWARGGREVRVWTEIDGTSFLMSVPLGGGAAQAIYRRPPLEWAYGPSVMGDQYLLYGVENEASEDAVVLKILDIRSGSERVVTRTAWGSFTAYNASQSGDRFVYADRRDGRFEFRAVRLDGEPTLLRAFPDTAFPPIIGVHGDRIAWWTMSEGQSTLYLAREGEPDAWQILTFPGEVGQRGLNPPTWSPNGRRLATGYWHPETADEDVLVVEFDGSGHAVGDPHVVDLPVMGWNLSWMPDGENMLIVGGDVWMVPIDGEAAPVNLTAEVAGKIWSYALSPDGRYLAVAPRVHRGGAIWRLDLEAVLAGRRAKGGQN